MRFSFPNWFAPQNMERWVHPSVEVGTREFARHSSFISLSFTLACALLLCLPVTLALGKAGSPIVVAAIVYAVMAVLMALMVSQLGRLELARKSLLFVLLASITTVCIASGGLGSPYVFLFLVIPLEAALMGGTAPILVSIVGTLVGICLVILFSSATGPIHYFPEPRGELKLLAMAMVWLYMASLAIRFERSRTTALELLSAEQDRFRLLADNATDLIARHDRKGRTLFASPAARTLFGVPSNAVLAFGLFEKIHLQDRISFLKSLSDASYTGQEQSCEFRIRCKGNADQAWKWVEMRCKPLREGQARQTDVVSIIRDITESKQQQTALQEASLAAEQSTEAQRRFLANMSHELRTPLNAILGFSDILKRQSFGPNAGGQYKEYASLIHESGDHLLNVVNDMLDMSRIEAGKYELALQELSFAELVGSVVKMLQSLAKDGQVKIDVKVAQNLPLISADLRACRQILINLLTNAIKFSEAGGIVQISIEQRSESLLFQVADNGVGIPAEALKSLGQPFMQADNGRDREFGGSGLGLSIVKGLVSLHGGDFKIKSAEGQGTRVSVALPLKVPKPLPVPTDLNHQVVHLPAKLSPVGEAKVQDQTKTTNRKGDSRARLSA